MTTRNQSGDQTLPDNLIPRWQSVREENQDVHVSHWVTNYEFFYEPFYVAMDDVPPHDERFVGYGFTRNTQVWVGPKPFLFPANVLNYKYIRLGYVCDVWIAGNV